ncbi:MAG TPA: RidA family protein [Gammaproteobacteria bacterium]|nr:RidA family protein [Gammaproteobacteria bacterium]
MVKQAIHTVNAPEAIGAYSQAIKVGQTVFISGQIPLEPGTMNIVDEDIRAQTHRVFNNLAAVAREGGGNLDDVVKLTVFLTDLNHFDLVNEVMAEHFNPPYPARAAVGVAALPKGVPIEIDAIVHLGD